MTKVASAVRPWTCYSNFLTCSPDGGEHLLKFHKTGFRADLRRISGHTFLQCTDCNPHTFIFVVLSTAPDSYATCYAISRESYLEYSKEASPTIASTPEMLHRLKDPQGNSLNATWRPIRDG